MIHKCDKKKLNKNIKIKIIMKIKNKGIAEKNKEYVRHRRA